MSLLQTFRIQDPESSGFRILKFSKMIYLQIFRIQDPESSGSKDPAGKSQEGPLIINRKLEKLLELLSLTFTSTLLSFSTRPHSPENECRSQPGKMSSIISDICVLLIMQYKRKYISPYIQGVPSVHTSIRNEYCIK